MRVMVVVNITKIEGFSAKERGNAVSFALKKGSRNDTSPAFEINELGGQSKVELGNDGCSLYLPVTLYIGTDTRFLDKSCYLIIRSTAQGKGTDKWIDKGAIEIPISRIANERQCRAVRNKTSWELEGGSINEVNMLNQYVLYDGELSGICCDVKVTLAKPPATSTMSGDNPFDDDSPPISAGSTEADYGDYATNSALVDRLRKELEEAKQALSDSVIEREQLHMALEKATRLGAQKSEQLLHSRARVSELRTRLSQNMELAESVSTPFRLALQQHTPKHSGRARTHSFSDSEEEHKLGPKSPDGSVAVAILKIENENLKMQLNEALASVRQLSGSKSPHPLRSRISTTETTSAASAVDRSDYASHNSIPDEVTGSTNSSGGEGQDEVEPRLLTPYRRPKYLSVGLSKGLHINTSECKDGAHCNGDDNGNVNCAGAGDDKEDDGNDSDGEEYFVTPSTHESEGDDANKTEEKESDRDSKGFERRYSSLFPSPTPAALAEKLERTTYSSDSSPRRRVTLTETSTQTSALHRIEVEVIDAAVPKSASVSAEVNRGAFLGVVNDLERARIEIEALRVEIEIVHHKLKQQKDKEKVKENERYEMEQVKMQVLEERLREQEREMKCRAEMVDEERTKVHALKAVLVNHTGSFSTQDSEMLYQAGVILTDNNVLALSSPSLS